MDLDTDLEAQIDRWRGFVQRRQAIAAADVDELEDHLRGQIEDLLASGLDHDEAFLVAIKRLGNLDAVSAEFAQEHSDRLWKQLVLVRDDDERNRSRAWRELAVVLGFALATGIAVKVGLLLAGENFGLARNLGLLVFPFLAAYLGWKRRLTVPVSVTLLASCAALAVLLNVYPYAAFGSTEVLAALHAPIVLWLLVGLAYVGGRWRSDARRMDFVRFTGELAIYYTLLALGGGVLIGLTVAVLSAVGVNPEPVLVGWILPITVPGALIVAAWLVEAKQNVVENIAPVLTRVFTPLTIVMLLAVLAVLTAAGGLATVDRDLLILMNAILVLVLSLLLYSISARDSLARPGLFDGLQLALVVVALAVDAVMLTAMVTRISEFGFSPNKIAALGLNLLLLVHLVRSAWLTLGFLRERRPFTVIERWQTRYLPVYGVWAAVVVVIFPLVFGFV
jgi:hypothetical protein